MYDSKTALQTRVQLEDFQGIFSPHFSVPLLKFIGQMLFGIQAATKQRDAVWEVVQGCLTRWRVEETIRFVKQSYHVEEVRNLMFAHVRNVAALVLTVTYFVAVRLVLYEKRAVLRQHITNVARRIFGAPEFHYYAIADGVRDLFMRLSAGLHASDSPDVEAAFVSANRGRQCTGWRIIAKNATGGKININC